VKTKEKKILIIVEGADRVGKDYIAKRLNKRLKYKHLIIIRAFMSNYIYDMKFNREKYDWIGVLRKIGKNITVLVILVKANGKQYKKMAETYKRDQMLFDAEFIHFTKGAGVLGVRVWNPGTSEITSSLSYLTRKVRSLE
jgi:thymidylate kinase